MRTYITYGAISAIAVALLNLALFFTGYQTEKLATGQYLQWIGFVIIIVVLVLGMRDVRESKPDKTLSYGQGVLAALMISVFYGLFTAVYTYIHFSFVNPNYTQYMLDIARSQMEAKNMPEAQIDAIIGMQAKMMTPVVMSIMTVIFAPIMGTIFGLIIAIFVKRQAPADAIKTA
ncbi:MAG: DUF4199 domain-containing protein [Opitutaceae bacterium]|jgi:hypothetical protein